MKGDQNTKSWHFSFLSYSSAAPLVLCHAVEFGLLDVEPGQA